MMLHFSDSRSYVFDLDKVEAALDKRRKDEEIEKSRQDFTVAENWKKIEEERINDVKTHVEKLAWDVKKLSKRALF